MSKPLGIDWQYDNMPLREGDTTLTPCFARRNGSTIEFIYLDGCEWMWRTEQAWPGRGRWYTNRRINLRDVLTWIPTKELRKKAEQMHRDRQRSQAHALSIIVEEAAKAFREGEYARANGILDDLSAWGPHHMEADWKAAHGIPVADDE